MANSPAFTIVISSKAQKEIAQAWDWYEDRQQGLGDRFVKEIVTQLERLKQTLCGFLNDIKTITRLLFLYFRI